MNIIGIDSGCTLVKIIEVDNKNRIINSEKIEKTSVENALNFFINKYKIDLKSIEKIVITGVGQEEITGNLLGIKTEKVDELTAIGIGGTYLAGKKNALIASIGTGTAIIKVEDGKVAHLGGTRFRWWNFYKSMQTTNRRK